MFENPRGGRQARNFTTNAPKILDRKSSSEPIFSENCRWVLLNCGKTLPNKLQKLQNRAARVITSSNFDVEVDSLFHKLSWKNLKSQRQIRNAWMVFKSLNGLVPEYLKSKFIKRNESNYSPRDSVKKLVVPFPRTNYLKNSFSYSGATLWNSLPCKIRESGSFNEFKRLLYHNV